MDSGDIRHTGREVAERLKYNPKWLDSLPPQVVQRFMGVGNPLSICMPQSGDDILDVGCGSGLDTYKAALQGTLVVGVDPTLEKLPPSNGTAKFLVARAEDLPFADESFDMVISNGALNLVPDKDRAYRELFRVLRKEGTLAIADLLVTEMISDDGLITGKDCLAKLAAAGFRDATIIGPTGYTTSRFTAAYYITAIRPG